MPTRLALHEVWLSIFEGFYGDMLPFSSMSKGRDGKAGRLGDDTRARINDLKGGWKLPGAAADEDEATKVADSSSEPTVKVETQTASPTPTPLVKSGALPSLPQPRPSKPTQPPPSPRSTKNSQPPPFLPKTNVPPGVPSAVARTKSASVPPPAPVPVLRAKSASVPPPAPGRDKPKPTLPPAAVVSTVGADDDEPTRITGMDEPSEALEQASSAMASRAPASRTPASRSPVGVSNATGTVRLPDSLPREPGLLGDIAYVFRVVGKRRSAKKEMREISSRIASEKEARNTKLLDYARHAVGDDSYDQTLVGRARASLLTIEEKRSHHAGRIASANEKVAALERQRKELKAKRDEDIVKLEMEIQAVAASLDPLVKKAGAARKKTTRLRLQLRAIDDEIQKKESSLVSVHGAADKASVHAEMASLRAERDAVASDEPAIASEIDGLEPKIASLTSSRGELADQIAVLRAEEELDIVRAEEKANAVNATRVVEERAVSDQAAKQEKQLLELGEGLHHNPPDTRDPKAAAIVRHDLEIGTLERRSLELSELLESVEGSAMVRGALYLGVMIAIPLAIAIYFAFLR